MDSKNISKKFLVDHVTILHTRWLLLYFTIITAERVKPTVVNICPHACLSLPQCGYHSLPKKKIRRSTANTIPDKPVIPRLSRFVCMIACIFCICTLEGKAEYLTKFSELSNANKGGTIPSFEAKFRGAQGAFIMCMYT